MNVLTISRAQNCIKCNTNKRHSCVLLCAMLERASSVLNRDMSLCRKQTHIHKHKNINGEGGGGTIFFN